MTGLKDGPRSVVPRPDYPECRVPYVAPSPGGVPFWKRPARNYFDDCTDACTPEVPHQCRVGVKNVGGRVYGCDGPCHDTDRQRLAAR